MERQLIHKDFKTLREKGRRETLDCSDYYYDPKTGQVIREDYIESQYVPYGGGKMKSEKGESVETTLNLNELPEVVRSKLKALLQ